MRTRTVLRILAILAATYAAVMFAWHAAALEPFALDLFLKVDAAFARLVSPIEAFVLRPLFSLGQAWGYDLALLPHWKYVLILTWLFATATERLVYRWPEGWRPNLLWGGISALAAGTLAGLVPAGDPRIMFAIAVGLMLSHFAAWVWEAVFDRVVQDFAIWDLLTPIAFIVILVLLNPDMPILPRDEFTSGAEVFGRLAYYWTYAGLLFAIFGMFDTLADGPWWQRWRTSPIATAGLDLLAVVIGASLLLAPAILPQLA